MILRATTDQRLRVDTVDRPDTIDTGDMIVGKPRYTVYLSNTPRLRASGSDRRAHKSLHDREHV